MKKISLFSLCSLFFANGCNNPSDKVDVYAVVPVQACEDTYTFIKSEIPNSDSMKLKKRMGSLDIYEKDNDVQRAINKELLSGKLKSKGQLRGGMEFTLSFSDKKKQRSFENEVHWRQCYIYLFKGYFDSKNINTKCAEENKLIVEDYKLILKYPDCAKKKDQESEEELRNMGDPYKTKIYKPIEPEDQ